MIKQQYFLAFLATNLLRSQQYLLVLFAYTLIVASTNYYKPFH